MYGGGKGDDSEVNRGGGGKMFQLCFVDYKNPAEDQLAVGVGKLVGWVCSVFIVDGLDPKDGGSDEIGDGTPTYVHEGGG